MIGAGPGGLEAALRARELGFKTALIEKSDSGGACLNTGCIPTKSLLASTKLLTKLSRAKEFGLSAGPITWDTASLAERKNRIVGSLRRDISDALGRAGVEWIQGEASLVGKNRLKILRGGVTHEVTARHILIAVGSEPVPFPGVPFDGEKILSSSQILELKNVSPRLLIIGGGVVGVEFASIFQALGTQVVMVEMLERIIATEDEEISRRLDSFFRRKGIEVYTGEKVKGLEKGPTGVKVLLESGKTPEADQVLVAMGRKPNLGRLGLERAGIKIERGLIQVNEFLETSTPGIFAIGDNTTRSTGLAHGASAEGVRVVENLRGKPVAMDYSAVPSCIYTDPEVASVGSFRPGSPQKREGVVQAKVLFAGLGKSQIEGEAEGFLKMAASKKDGRILGVTAIGAHVTELIAEATLALRNGLSVRAVAETIHPHPTESEILQKVAEKLSRQIFS